jgi:hypothetical protein
VEIDAALYIRAAVAEWREQTTVPERTHREALSYAEA